MYPFKPWTWRPTVSTPLDVLRPAGHPAGGESACGELDGGRQGPATIGYWVKAEDGYAGYVDGASADVDDGYLVVDTATLVCSRCVLLPVDIIARTDHAEHAVHVGCAARTIRSAPEYERSALETPGYLRRVIDHYAAADERSTG